MTTPQTVEVTKLMTGRENLHLKAGGAGNGDITAIAEQLDDRPLEINDENLSRAERTRPLAYVMDSDVVREESVVVGGTSRSLPDESVVLRRLSLRY